MPSPVKGLIATTVNLSPEARAALTAAGRATGRSASSWLRRALEHLHVTGEWSLGAPQPVPLTPASVAAAVARPTRGDPPDGARWTECVICEADIGKVAWIDLSQPAA